MVSTEEVGFLAIWSQKSKPVMTGSSSTWRPAGHVCRRCGISRPTLRKWRQRYQQQGLEGLTEHSRRSHTSPGWKINAQMIRGVLDLRAKRNLGARRIQTELLRVHDCSLALAAIHKILAAHQVSPVKRLKRKKHFKRYQRPVPGDRVQLDTCKIAPGIYQYTAVDDCSRWRVLELYKRRTAANTLDFIDGLVERFPFPIQRIQTDKGREFFAVKVQEKLKVYSIKFRPIKPTSPHLNGRVERSQKTDLEEFYATADLSDVGNGLAVGESLPCGARRLEPIVLLAIRSAGKYMVITGDR